MDTLLIINPYLKAHRFHTSTHMLIIVYSVNEYLQVTNLCYTVCRALKIMFGDICWDRDETYLRIISWYTSTQTRMSL